MPQLTAFVGDTHGNLKLMYERLLAWQERTGLWLSQVWQVGDFGIWPTKESLDPPSIKHARKHGYTLEEALGDFQEIFLGNYKIPIPTYLTRGNHEDQVFLMTFEKQLQKDHPKDYLSRAAPICDNLLYVPDGHVIELGGKRIASWGGCFSAKTWEMGYWSEERKTPSKKKGNHPNRLNHMTRDRFELLMRSQFDILVTHEAPLGCGVHGAPNPSRMLIDPEEMTGGGVQQITELINMVRPEYQFNGHWHEFCQSQIGQTKCMVLDKVHPDKEDARWMEVLDIG